MNIALRTAVLLVSALQCTSCMTMGRVGNDAQPPDAGHAYFVLGVAPQNMDVTIFRGTIHDGMFQQDGIAAATFSGMPEDGFVLGETHAGNSLAITFVIPHGVPGLPSRPMIPCGSGKTLTFSAPGGKVVYVGSVYYRVEGDGLAPAYRDDLEGARKFVATRYPALAGLVEKGHPEMIEFGGTPGHVCP
ncbi:MAG: hypothetical protein JOZ72_15175 [Alphaproteobacteria bacterium]|nr:hypothetical protein [Alphaproteobacteria bacterium]